MLNYDINSISEVKASQVPDKFLRDYTKKGRKIEWRERKMRSERLAEIYEYLYSVYQDEDYNHCYVYPDRYLKRAELLRNCSSYLVFSLLEDGRKKLTKASFCRVRLCPMCAWRRTLKLYANMSKIVSQMQGYRFILLTLTVKNCFGVELSSVLDDMFYGFRLFSNFKAFKQSIEGFYRGLEVTYNKLSDTYHPHFHCLLAVKPSYFSGLDYISQAEFQEMWRNAMKLDYAPSVDVRAVKGNTLKAVCEISKYTVKDVDYIKQQNTHFSAEILYFLDRALTGRRLISFGGIFKKIHKELNLQDEMDGDLVDTGQEDFKAMEKVVQQTYIWNTGFNNYVLADERFLG